MYSLGKRPDGLRLERIKASRLWGGKGFRNFNRIADGLRVLTDPVSTRASPSR